MLAVVYLIFNEDTEAAETWRRKHLKGALAELMPDEPEVQCWR